jgi:hypothetical protein
LLLIAFSRGQVVALNTKKNEVAEELWSGRVHDNSLFGMAYSDSLKRGATAGDGGIKIVDMQGGGERLQKELREKLYGNRDYQSPQRPDRPA